ncbi:MAG: hypothetical protein AMJ81_03960 [Phycisphaerae bacterium SM23_33]|nr:MAG: hypothetical protein AMJ81_03960 [Phycisphaerae bacterium SM23_33]
MSSAAVNVNVPITVRNFSEHACPSVPVWTGVPLPKSAAADAGAFRLLDSAGAAVPAQFDVLATWSDGSIKWVLVSFFAAPGPVADGAPAPERYCMVADGSLPVPQLPQPVRAEAGTELFRVATGPLKFYVNRHGFTGLSQVRLDTDRDGRFDADDLIAPDSPAAGIFATDADGTVHASRFGRLAGMEVERAGPLHATVAVRGDLRAPEGDRPLLDYTMRIHAFAGSSLLRVVLTVRNPRPAGRPDDGCRWLLGQSGAVLLKSLEYVLPLRLPEGHRRVTLSTEPGRMLERIPLTGELRLYQDSSGGANWFHRTHVNRDDDIPLRFRGYRVYYHDREIGSGLRAEPWLDVADMRWAVSLAAPQFWQNFPKSLGVDRDGAIRLGLWPALPADQASLHEIQGGEQKTHEFWLYFRHRQGGREVKDRMPLAREVMPACLHPPVAWAAADVYAASETLDPILPAQPRRFEEYEAMVAAAVRGQENLFTHIEQADELGWRHFGDTPAFNERDQTQGPYHGLGLVSHYNNEYDLGFGELLQAMRNAEADPALAKAWWDLGLAALRHEADIDVYHCTDDPAPIYNGGTFTHTSHGVDAGRSTHRGSPTDEMWGRLDWPWHRGSNPEAGHLRNRGILLAYLLTGDRHLLDAAWELVELVSFKIRADRFAQISVPDRCGGNNLQILLDAHLMTWDRHYLELCETIVANLDFQAVTARSGEPQAGWQSALYLKSLGRFIETLAEKGTRHEKAIASYLKYARCIEEHCRSRRGGHHEGPWSYLICEVLMQAAELADDPAEQERFLAAADGAFHALDKFVGPDGRGHFWNSKQTTMLLQGGGRYMRHAMATAKKAARSKRKQAPKARPRRARAAGRGKKGTSRASRRKT